MLHNIKVILTDIEGTTSSISFVHDILFPYAKKNLASYLNEHAKEQHVQQIVAQIKKDANAPHADLSQIIQILENWMETDKKITSLKELQGYIWEDGFHKQDFKGHLYPDAYQYLQQWKKQGYKIYIYSSGSEKAQRLLFQFSEYGNLLHIFDGYFDTRIGGKKEITSYQKISEAIHCKPAEILFLSDVIDELNAAAQAGMKTMHLVRYQQSTVNQHSIARDFSDIKL